MLPIATDFESDHSIAEDNIDDTRIFDPFQSMFINHGNFMRMNRFMMT